jgi:RNA polymerase sigma-70 factor (ECF subfamily)
VNNLIQEQFLKLYTPVHEPLYRFCRAISGNKEDAEDLIHDTVLTAFESMEKLKDTNAFRSYIFSIASNLNKIRFRRSKFRSEFDEKELTKIADFAANPELITDFKIVCQKMLALPPKVAEALVLFHISDISLEEIQKIQGGSLSGVKLRLKRGRQKLLESLNTSSQKKVAVMFFTL